MSRLARRRLIGFTLTFAALLLAASLPAQAPADKEPPKEDKTKEKPKEPAAKGPAAAISRVSAVTVYPNSAVVTREVDVPAGMGTMELVVTPLPAQTVNTSLYAEGAGNIRVLATRFRTHQLIADTRDDVRKLDEEIAQLQAARQKLDTDIKAVQENLTLLTRLEGYTSNTATKEGAANSASTIALTKYIMDTRSEKLRELVALQQQVQGNGEKTDFARRRLTELAASSQRTERDAVLIVDKAQAAAGKVKLSYLVDAASWRPQYKLRAGKGAKDPVQLEYLAAIVQQTGESWDNVQIVLSTAQPMLHAAPPDLQVLNVSASHRAGTPPPADLLAQARELRLQAQKNFNERRQVSAIGLCNAAAALDQSFELLHPSAVPVRKDCAPIPREGPSVTFSLASKLTVPSRNDEQVVEMARLDLAPDYYSKAVPVLTEHVYRLADLTNKSNHVILPGEATMYLGEDFVGRMTMPLVAVGEQFTAGFGVDPQVQVDRQMIGKTRTIQGGNQILNFEFRILINNYKTNAVRLQVWDRLPFADNQSIGVSLVKTTPELSKDAFYVREQRPGNLLRWDVVAEAGQYGEKAVQINYQFKVEFDKQMNITSFQASAQRDDTPFAATGLPPLSAAEEADIRNAFATLSVEDRRLCEAQVFCAVEEESRLGALGTPHKIVLKGKPVFVCCKGCLAEAQANPDQTLARVQRIAMRVQAAKSPR